MENFPSTDVSSWDYIRALINECDFYVMILGGRYGSMTDEGISYTEKEYKYACSQGLPIYVFIYDDHCLSKANCDEDPIKVEKMKLFKGSVRSKICNTFKSKDDLASLVSTTLHTAIMTKNSKGWMRINQTIEDLIEENKELKRKVDEQNIISNYNVPDWENKLIKHDDIITINGTITVSDMNIVGSNNVIDNIQYKYTISWDKLFAHLNISPFITLGYHGDITQTLWLKIEEEALSSFDRSKYKPGIKYRFLIEPGLSHDIVTHMIALGLLDTKFISYVDPKTNQNTDETRYFLTEKGKKEYCRLHALYKTSE